MKANLTHGINTVLISPRRWGKTSLVRRVIDDIHSPTIMTVFVDVFQCKSEYEFCHLLATSVIKQTSSKIEEWVEMAKTFLANITPKFSFGPDPMNDFSISLEWDEKDDPVSEVLQLPEKIARKKGVKLVVCIDEFQQVGDFSDYIAFQKKMRTVWQHQQSVTYCVFGSKKHLMESFFNDRSMPFYKFGDMMFLKKIPTEQWVPFISEKFSGTGKTIANSQAARICSLTDNLSSLVQHLSWVVWYKSDVEVEDRDIDSAVDDLLEQNTIFFQREVEQLTEYQLNLLRALADGITTGLSRREVIKRYRFENSANVQAAKKALLRRDLIEQDGDQFTFSDPLFRLWLQRQRVSG